MLCTLWTNDLKEVGTDCVVTESEWLKSYKITKQLL